MHIDFHDQTDSIRTEYIDLLKDLIQFTAKKENVPNVAEVSINFVYNDDIREINREYRHQDKVTDVISFAMQERLEDEMEIVGANLPVVLGDIIISVDKAKEQAKEYNHSFERELGFLAVHGFLHLLGYDHIKEDEEKKMFKRQDEILGEFGLER